MKRIHFIEEGKERGTLRCRILGHKFEEGIAHLDCGCTEEVNVCLRCYALKHWSYKKIESITLKA